MSAPDCEEIHFGGGMDSGPCLVLGGLMVLQNQPCVHVSHRSTLMFNIPDRTFRVAAIFWKLWSACGNNLSIGLESNEESPAETGEGYDGLACCNEPFSRGIWR